MINACLARRSVHAEERPFRCRGERKSAEGILSTKVKQTAGKDVARKTKYMNHSLLYISNIKRANFRYEPNGSRV
jgi:hypothetical protein